MPGLGGGRIGHHVADHGLHIRVGHLLVLDHVQAGEQRHGQHHVHEGPGEGDDQPLPARLGQETARIVDILVARLLAGHLDVAAEQNQREAVVRFAAAEAEQARPKPKLKASTLTSK